MALTRDEDDGDGLTWLTAVKVSDTISYEGESVRGDS